MNLHQSQARCFGASEDLRGFHDLHVIYGISVNRILLIGNDERDLNQVGYSI